MIYVVHYGPGGELERRPVPADASEQELSKVVAELAASSVLAVGDTIKIEELSHDNR